ncbi:hypothetical protein [Nocardia sp. NPDC046763]|uniref:YciI family protein n=1 Tax=Nocardia sp. NPDC046763 TaxID=3155256 RepID=UPI00340A82AF
MSRYLLMLRSDETTTPGAPPQELFEAIGKAAAEWTAAGVLRDTAGLAPAATGTRIDLTDDTINTGPIPAGENVTAYAIIEVTTTEDAIGRATEFLELHKQHWPGWNGASEIRQIYGA